jgi:Flp pilus assembly protein protease CpaA
MLEVILLICLGFVWTLFATIQDIRKTEIANWVNFSLIIFAIGIRFFFSLFSGEGFDFFYQGLIWFGIFFVVGNLFYSLKMFAGGDGKLFIALGPIVTIFSGFWMNLQVFVLFILVFLFVAFVYSLVSTTIIGLKSSKKLKKEMKKQYIKYKRLIILLLALAIMFLVASFFYKFFLFFAITLFILPYLLVFVISVDEACMVRQVSPRRLMEGDWLYKSIIIGEKKIKAKFEGLSEKEIKLLKKRGKKIWIRFGVPFAPVFLITYILLFVFVKLGFLEKVWNLF